MKTAIQPASSLRGGFARWRAATAAIALGILTFCSCRVPSQQEFQNGEPMAYGHAAAPRNGLPAEAYAGAAAASAGEAEATAEATAGDFIRAPGMENGVPLPYQPQGPWTPPGMGQPWPKDEYLRDGGDARFPVKVNRDSRVLGLEMEDTVAHYDTLDGRTLVEPSNDVHIYSPRFGAVRQVVNVQANEERQKVGGLSDQKKLNFPRTTQFVAGAKQQIQVHDEIGAKLAMAMRTKQGDGVVSTVIGLRGFQDRFKPYENLAAIRQGVFENTEMAMLALGSTAAIAWSHTQSVQIILDHQGAMAEVKYDKSLSLYTVSSPPGHPRLQLVKVASTPFAKPGEEVDFTLRFDNVGDEPIGNVTIIDSLTTRLEYIADSAQCSSEAKFSTEPNEGDSLVLRCELTQPLEPGQGGVVRFRCRVR